MNRAITSVYLSHRIPSHRPIRQLAVSSTDSIRTASLTMDAPRRQDGRSDPQIRDLPEHIAHQGPGVSQGSKGACAEDGCCHALNKAYSSGHNQEHHLSNTVPKMFQNPVLNIREMVVTANAGRKSLLQPSPF